MARTAGWPPRWLTTVPLVDRRRGDGALVADFGEAVCRVTKDSVAAPAGQLLSWRGWQRQLFEHLLARRGDGRLRHRSALIGLARKNGKSNLAAPIGLGSLILGVEGGEVYSCAGDRAQAAVVFGIAKRMVELDPELSELLKCYRDVIEFPRTGSIYKALSAEAYTKEGLNPTTVLFDEVHVQPNRELWDVMALATGARTEPLIVGISTAGVQTDTTGGDSLCFSLYQYGCRVAAGEVADPGFFFAWWEPRLGSQADHRNPKVWREANPGLGDLLSVEDFEQAVLRTPEAEFRTKRCNQWVSASITWLPSGSWEALTDRRGVDAGREVVLAFDGSYSGDSTGLTVHDVRDPHRHVDVAGCWERPAAVADWHVDADEVETVLRAACERWSVLEVIYDPRIWQQMFDRLAAEGYPVVAMTQGVAMIEAAQAFYEAVTGGQVTHSGDVRLARHLRNAVVKPSPTGPRVQKETPNSPRKIDLGICAVMGDARARWHAQNAGVDLW